MRAHLSRIVNRPRSIIDPRREFLRQNIDPTLLEDDGVIARMATRLKSSVDRLAILCLASKVTNLLLWSHYADKHQGCCLKFRTDISGDWFSQALRVRYQSDFPVIRLLDEPDDQRINKLLLTKASAWRYEGEWRVIDPKRRAHHQFIPASLVGIIFGLKMSARPRSIIREWLREREYPVKVYGAATSEERGFRVKIDRIS